MIAESAIVGGEGNGGVILTNIIPGRDAAVGVILILEALAAAEEPKLSALTAAIPRYFIEKRKVSCTNAQLKAAVESMSRRYPQAYIHPVNDGVKLYFNGRLECPWVHLRASNTEPVVRIIAESTSSEEAVALCDGVESELSGQG